MAPHSRSRGSTGREAPARHCGIELLSVSPPSLCCLPPSMWPSSLLCTCPGSVGDQAWVSPFRCLRLPLRARVTEAAGHRCRKPVFLYEGSGSGNALPSESQFWYLFCFWSFPTWPSYPCILISHESPIRCGCTSNGRFPLCLPRRTAYARPWKQVPSVPWAPGQGAGQPRICLGERVLSLAHSLPDVRLFPPILLLTSRGGIAFRVGEPGSFPRKEFLGFLLR